MLVISLLILSLVMGTIILTIHDSDEIHQMLAFLSGSIALVCVYILIPPIVKICLGLSFFAIGYKILPHYSSFK